MFAKTPQPNATVEMYRYQIWRENATYRSTLSLNSVIYEFSTQSYSHWFNHQPKSSSTSKKILTVHNYFGHKKVVTGIWKKSANCISPLQQMTYSIGCYSTPVYHCWIIIGAVICSISQGIMVFASVMATLGLSILLESVWQLIAKKHNLSLDDGYCCC